MFINGRYILKNDLGLSLSLKEFLRIKGFSRSLLIKIKKTDKIFLGKNKIKLYTDFYPDELVDFFIEEEKTNLEYNELPLNIIYEDQDILAVNKTDGLVVHPIKNYPNKTLINGIMYYLKATELRPRLINRLDKDTSGLVLFSKNLYAHNHIQKQLKYREIKKTYLALVEGHLEKKIATINAPITRVDEKSIRRKVSSEGQEAITKYEVLEEFSDYSLLRIYPITGRTHQIRVHMNFLGHPLLGDELYGKKSYLIGRQALHAESIEMKMPWLEENKKIIAPLPFDMKVLI